MMRGYATGEATARFAASSGALDSNYKTFCGLTLSNVGIGTYLGDADSATDRLVKDAVKQSVSSGMNVIDTAINYRAQKAERSVGRAISELASEGTASREQLFVCTKNGYVTNDADVQTDFWGYVKEELTSRGVVGPGDISSGYHCMTVPYLSDQLERSLRNLNLDCIDLLYLHNAVEGQARDMTRGQLKEGIRKAFELYEKKRGEGKIRFYGMATWECFRVPPDSPLHLSLHDTVEMARQAGGDDHGFRFIQVPFNMYHDQALLKRYQKIGGNDASILECAQKTGVGVFGSVPLMQGRLLRPGAMPEFGDLAPPLRALQFIRSAPGMLAPLVGQKSQEHVAENTKIMGIGPIPPGEFESLVSRLTS